MMAALDSLGSDCYSEFETASQVVPPSKQKAEDATPANGTCSLSPPFVLIRKYPRLLTRVNPEHFPDA